MTQAAFIALITPFQDKVFRMAKRLLTSQDAAQDATQDVLLKLWKQRENLSNYSSPEALAMTMTKNHCFDKLKAKGNNNLKIVHNNYIDHSTNTSKQVEVKSELEWLQFFMAKLPEQQKIIIQMRDVEQYTNAETAAILKISEGAVRVALSRARKTLRAQLINTQNYGIR